MLGTNYSDAWGISPWGVDTKNGEMPQHPVDVVDSRASRPLRVVHIDTPSVPAAALQAPRRCTCGKGVATPREGQLESDVQELKLRLRQSEVKAAEFKRVVFALFLLGVLIIFITHVQVFAHLSKAQTQQLMLFGLMNSRNTW